MKKNLNNAFSESIIKSELKEIISDSIEISIDQITDNELVREIPIIKSILSIYKVGIGIKERFTVKKILFFLHQLNDIPNDRKTKFLEKIATNTKYKNSIYEKLLIIIDQLDDLEKSKIVGNLFSAAILDNIDLDTFFKLSFIVQRAFTEDLKSYCYYGNRKIDEETKLEYLYKYTDSVKKNLVSLGLLNESISMKIHKVTEKPAYSFEYKHTSLGDDMRNYAF